MRDHAPDETPIRVLVVDDDRGIREVLTDYLSRHGFEAEAAADGRQMQRALDARPYDAIVLDLMMPGEDGLTITRRLADGPRPAIIMLSAMGEDTDRIVGLELGADDYLAKPCNPRELVARLRAVLRRRGEAPADGAREAGVCIRFAGWSLDLVRRELLSPEGTAVGLSNGEFQLLRVLAERPFRVLTRDQLLDLARGQAAEAFDRSIDVQISRLRRKLDDGMGRSPIETVRGAGYRFGVEAVRR